MFGRTMPGIQTAADSGWVTATHSRERLRILTWHVHGSYLYYLSHAPHEFYLPVRPEGGDGYWGRGRTFPFGSNVHEVPLDQVREQNFDCVLYQSRANYLEDRDILSAEQLRLPQIYLEHDPPRQHPTDTRHIVDDPGVLLVHVTHFNALMWDSGRTPARVIEHGVVVPPGARYTGELPSGLVVVNNLARRGRRLGADVVERVGRAVPLTIVGMNSEEAGGIGEVPPPELAGFAARYRYLFNPIRWTSLGLAVCEAMMVGLPIVGLATTEMVTVVENGVSGYLDTDVERLACYAAALSEDRGLARCLGEGARRTALERFNIERFAADWDGAFHDVVGATKSTRVGPVAIGART